MAQVRETMLTKVPIMNWCLHVSTFSPQFDEILARHTRQREDKHQICYSYLSESIAILPMVQSCLEHLLTILKADVDCSFCISSLSQPTF